MSDGAGMSGKGPAAGKGAPPPKSAGKGAAKGGGKGLSYKEKKELEMRELEDKLSAEQGFSGKDLTEAEAKVINEKGTEAQGTGEYEKFQPLRGYFACRKCGKPIYSYRAKFESGCGWPAFDKCYAGSINTRPEDDGTSRVEIACANCGAHLGHVFVEPGTHTRVRSEQRHCANSLALQYVKHEPPAGTVLEEAVLVLPELPAVPVAAPAPVAADLPTAAPVLLLETRGDGVTFPGPGDRVAVHYTGMLVSGGEPFDSSRAGDAFEFTVGGGGVVEGWDLGVRQMPLGSRGFLIVPAALGYGERGMPGAIPPHADLVFDIELLSINGRRAPDDCLPHAVTQAGFLHRHLTPVLRPVLLGLLRERPADPCGRLLRSLEPGTPAREAFPPPPFAGTPQEYATCLQPVLQEISVVVLGCFGQPESVLPALTAWLQQNAQRLLSPAQSAAEAG